MKKKLTTDQKLLEVCYYELLKTKKDIPTVAEVQELFNKKYGANGSHLAK